MINQDLNPKEILSSTKAKKWYRDNIQTLTNINIQKDILSNHKKMVNKLMIGSMFMYLYDPKTKEKLPYWDIFPLTIVLDYDEISFIGLNLHYIPIKQREILLNNMLDLINNKKYNNTTTMKATYELLKSYSKFKYMRPCVKRYYFKNIKSNIIKVPPIEWAYSIYLPVESFKGAIKEHVWSDSQKRIL